MKKMIFVPYRSDFHAGLKENEYQYGKITPIAYRFDLKTSDWNILGETTSQTIDILKEADLFKH
jgi:phage major head subunit gpT-like protein